MRTTRGTDRAGELAALGTFLLLLGIFLTTCTGSLDITDGLKRYDVARNLLDRGEPLATHPLLARYVYLENKRTHKRYRDTNAAGSITPMPFMALSRALPGHTEKRDY